MLRSLEENITDDGIEILAKELKKCPKLARLTVGFNMDETKITERGQECLRGMKMRELNYWTGQE